jgi:hypothetical protein
MATLNRVFMIQNNDVKSKPFMFTTFTLGDVSRVPLPVGVDIALCRDALQHLPMSEAVRLLRNLAAARPQHVLLGSYSSERANVTINVGDE